MKFHLLQGNHSGGAPDLSSPLDWTRKFLRLTALDAYRCLLLSALLALSLWGSHGIASVEVAQAGTLEGTVHYLGSQPAPRVMKITKDQDHCGTEAIIQTINIHGAHGALSDAVVSVEGMKEDVQTEPTEGSVLNMHCAFAPRIGTARKGQVVEVRNQDPILHNTHIKYGKRTFLNVAQVPGGDPIVKQLKRTGLHDIRCDKHVFMEGALHVFSHPFYALTNQTGTFRITGIPAGEHHIHVWHETLGMLDEVVTIPSIGTVQLNFAYK